MQDDTHRQSGPETPATPPVGCGGDCAGCAGSGQHEHGAAGHRMPDSQWAGGLAGWKLTLAAGIAFLAPLLLAILGATLAGEGANRRFLGAGVGLALGVTMAILITKYLARRWDQPTGEPRSDKEQA